MCTSAAFFRLDTTKDFVSKENYEGSCRYRCPWRLRALATPNSLALPHAAASIVTSTLTPFSTGTGAHFITRSHPPRRFDRNFWPQERNNIDDPNERYAGYTIFPSFSPSREFVKKISPDRKIREKRIHIREQCRATPDMPVRCTRYNYSPYPGTSPDVRRRRF